MFLPKLFAYVSGGGEREGTLRVWDIEREEVRYHLQGFTPYIGSLHLDASRLLVDGANDAILCLDFGASEEGDGPT